MNLRLRAVLVVLPCVVAACAVGAQDAGEAGGVVEADAPLVGVDGSGDSADTNCHVVLRSMARIPNNTGGYVTRNHTNWVWRAVIDVSNVAVAEGDVPSVLYRPAGSDGWKSVDAVAQTSSGGFTRFVAEVWEGMPTEGMSGTALRNTRVPVIPYLKLTQGGRLFDHNRIGDPMGSYVISGEAGLAIGEDPAVCTQAPSGTRPPVGWIGNAVVAISRAAGAPCDDGVPMGDGFTYGTWARQRAARRNVCFEVWQQGVTDRANPDIWQQIDVQVHYRYSANDAWQSAYVSMVDRVGNNARYALDLSGLDPFRPYHCTTEAYAASANGQYDEAGLEFYFTANGSTLVAGSGASFRGTYQDYRTNHCP